MRRYRSVTFLSALLVLGAGVFGAWYVTQQPDPRATVVAPYASGARSEALAPLPPEETVSSLRQGMAMTPILEVEALLGSVDAIIRAYDDGS
ncbi:hypothetical protein HY632_03875 [Candidatus Uhrbacteria bacterium]|nr:hypothetical protein [Candidatus Uhrbacteria bacterium]